MLKPVFRVEEKSQKNGFRVRENPVWKHYSRVTNLLLLTHESLNLIIFFGLDIQNLNGKEVQNILH